MSNNPSAAAAQAEHQQHFSQVVARQADTVYNSLIPLLQPTSFLPTSVISALVTIIGEAILYIGRMDIGAAREHVQWLSKNVLELEGKLEAQEKELAKMRAEAEKTKQEAPASA